MVAPSPTPAPHAARDRLERFERKLRQSLHNSRIVDGYTPGEAESFRHLLTLAGILRDYMREGAE